MEEEIPYKQLEIINVFQSDYKISRRQNSLRVAAVDLFFITLRDIQAVKKRVGPVHKSTVLHEIVRAVDKVLDTHQGTGAVEGRLVPAERSVEIELLHVLARPARNLFVFVGEVGNIETQVHSPCQERQRTT